MPKFGGIITMEFDEADPDSPARFHITDHIATHTAVQEACTAAGHPNHKVGWQCPDCGKGVSINPVLLKKLH